MKKYRMVGWLLVLVPFLVWGQEEEKQRSSQKDTQEKGKLRSRKKVSEAKRKAISILERSDSYPGDFDFDGESLSDVLEYLMGEYPVRFRIDPEVLAHRTSEELRLQIKTKDLSLKHFLELSLGLLDLDFQAHGEEILITEKPDRQGKSFEAKMDQNIPFLEFEDSFPRVIQFLANCLDVKIRIESEVLRSRSPQELLVKVNVKDISLKEALRLLVGLHDLDYQVRRQTIWIVLKKKVGLKQLDLKGKLSDAQLAEKLKAHPDVQVLDLRYTQVTDAGLIHLESLGRLQELNLGRTQVTDAGLRHLAGLHRLHTLYLDEILITDVGVKHLVRLKTLRVLGLGGSRIADAGLAHLAGLTALEELDLSGTQITDAGLVHLRSLVNLKSILLFANRGIQDAGLRHLTALPNLRYINLACTGITDEGLVRLRGLTELESLYIYGNSITDDGLRFLRSFSQLKHLNLQQTEVTNAGLVHLGWLKRLKWLSLGTLLVGNRYSWLTDDGLRHLSELENLEELWLPGCGITGAGVRHLHNLGHLKELHLGHCWVNDEDLHHFEGLVNLKTLILYHNGVSERGVGTLRKALPDCQIEFEFPE